MEYDIYGVVKKYNIKDYYNGKQVSVRLGDLISSVSWLSQVDASNAYLSLIVNFSYEGEHSYEEMVEIIDDLNQRKMLGNCEASFELLDLSFEDYPPNPKFCYSDKLLLNLNSIQVDGKRLLEHCSTLVKCDERGKKSTTLVVDKDIEDVLVIFDLKKLNKERDYWYPVDLIRQAIIDCVENSRGIARVRKK